eukprot:jgi/Ulvmu1/5603/UM023_0140.1
MTEAVRVESVEDDEEEMNLMETGGDEYSSPEQAVGEERDLTKDGGVIKKLLVPGEGWELPQKDDKVIVHYTGTLEDGTKFDSSVDRGDPFEFTLGHSQVIKGWDVGVATMKKGEKVQLKLRHDYAYGESGSPPKIPPGATLLFEVELLRWESMNDLSEEKDGSLVKTVTKEGDLDVWDRPKDPDLVTIKLSAKVAGATECFVKNEETEFTVGDGCFCPAVKIAVSEMKKGEAVKLKVGPQYGFGDAGREGVPAGASLELELELLKVKAVKTVDPDHLGHISKIIEKDGAAYNTPNDYAEVLVSWEGFLSDGTQFDQMKEFKCKVNEDPFPNEAVELAVMSMRSGEEAIITVHEPEYAFGAAGVEGVVPPNEVVKYNIVLHSFEAGPENWDMTSEQKLARADDLKQRGNQAMKAGKLGKAQRLYTKVDNTLTNDQGFSEEEKIKQREIQVSASLNKAAASLKLGNYKECIAECKKVLEKRPSHVKALFRRSQAYLELGDMLEAENDLKAAMLEDPGSRDLMAAMKKLKQRMKAANKKDAKLFGAMFSKVGKMYEDVPTPAEAVPADGPIDEVEPVAMQTDEAADVAAAKVVDAGGDAIMQDADQNVAGNA